jgi:hypothetical protein
MNLLYVSVINSAEVNMPEFITELEDTCFELTQGFTCFLALPDDPSLIQKDVDFINNTEKLIHAYGAKKIVRVTKQGDLPAGTGFTTLSADSV